MKKTFALCAALCCALALCAGCAKAEVKTAYDHGLDIVNTMEEMAKCPEYIALTTSNEYMTEALKPVQEGEVGDPAAVYTVTLDEDYFALMSEWINVAEIPESIKAAADKRLVAAFSTQINALGGAQVLAASSLCAAGTTFVDEGVTDNVVYLYIFEDCPPAAVTFTPGEDGSVAASGLFLLYDGVDYRDAAALEAFFAEMGAELSAYEG